MSTNLLIIITHIHKYKIKTYNIIEYSKQMQCLCAHMISHQLTWSLIYSWWCHWGVFILNCTISWCHPLTTSILHKSFQYMIQYSDITSGNISDSVTHSIVYTIYAHSDTMWCQQLLSLRILHFSIIVFWQVACEDTSN